MTEERDEAEIEASRAPLLEHLIELRARLIKSLLAFIVMFFGCFFFSKQIYNILVYPYVSIVGAQNAELIATHFLEQVFTNIKLSVFGAGFLAFPVIATQVYAFVAPGLYRNERQAFLPYLVATPVFFVLGALVVYFLAMPLLIQFSVSLQQIGQPGEATIKLLPKVDEYLSLIMTLILGFGIMFQLPVVLSLLAQAGIITAAQLRGFRRYAIVAITAVAGVLSPPDPFSMIAMALPTILLYEAGIWRVDWVEKQRAKNSPADAAAAS